MAPFADGPAEQVGALGLGPALPVLLAAAALAEPAAGARVRA